MLSISCKPGSHVTRAPCRVAGTAARGRCVRMRAERMEDQKPPTEAVKQSDDRAMAAVTGGDELCKQMNGISAPTGYFDPAQFAVGTTQEQVKRYRESELTHGRVCMLAAVGFLVGEAVQHKTLFYNWDGDIQGPAIVHFQQTHKGFYEPLLLFIGISESYRVARGWANPAEKGAFTLKDEYKPGDLGFDPLGLCPKSQKEFDIMQTKEINNGRLAMIAVAGFVAQELVNHKGIIENLRDSA